MDDEKETPASEPAAESQASEQAEALTARDTRKGLKDLRSGEGITVDPGEPGENPFKEFEPPPDQAPQKPAPSNEPPPGDGGEDSE